MHFSTLITHAALAASVLSLRVNKRANQAHNEQVTAQGLLGSHFGAIDISATYDYVIVGGGTAGLTVARRLAQHYTVAVIEAGGFYEVDNANITEVPADAGYYAGKKPVFDNPLIDWRQMTTPQPGFGGESVLFPQGRALGGSSSRNFMWYQRGSKGSYQKWADQVGDEAYTFSRFLPFLKRSVKYSPPNHGARFSNSTPRYNPGNFDPHGGPLHVSYPNFASPAASWSSLGFEAIGWKQSNGSMVDGNLVNQWAWIGMTIDPVAQSRSTSESSMLREAVQLNDNLGVYANTLAKRILFNDKKAATGVVLETSGLGSGSVTWQINATREVIVSAGAFRSPQMLMVSGVGPKATLESNGIKVIADRPGVGQGMWDQPFFGISRQVNAITHNSLTDPAFAAQAAAEYNANRTGILTNVGADIIGFEKIPRGGLSNSTRSTLDVTFGSDWPDIELLVQDAYTGTFNDYLFDAPDQKAYSTVACVLVAPFSRGNVTIESSDTSVHPIVNPAWLTDPRDQEVAIAGFKRARAVYAAKAVQPILIGGETYPGANVTTDKQILQAVRESSDTIHHAACTCRMGRSNDSMAVVDSKGRVFGVKGLRVVDASAFPLLPPGQPQATVYGLAEKIANDILMGTS